MQLGRRACLPKTLQTSWTLSHGLRNESSPYSGTSSTLSLQVQTALQTEIDATSTFKAYNVQRTTNEGQAADQKALAVYSKRICLVNHKCIIERVRRDKTFKQEAILVKLTKKELKQTAADAKVAAADVRRLARATAAAAKANAAAARLHSKQQRIADACHGGGNREQRDHCGATAAGTWNVDELEASPRCTSQYVDGGKSRNKTTVHVKEAMPKRIWGVRDVYI